MPLPPCFSRFIGKPTVAVPGKIPDRLGSPDEVRGTLYTVPFSESALCCEYAVNTSVAAGKAAGATEKPLYLWRSPSWRSPKQWSTSWPKVVVRFSST